MTKLKAAAVCVVLSLVAALPVAAYYERCSTVIRVSAGGGCVGYDHCIVYSDDGTPVAYRRGPLQQCG